MHTHLDAQIAWDPDATSSCWHGVTSVVLGNCGVTFAPVRKGEKEWLAELMESVEDIPAASILEGLAWDWETYGEYLGAIDALPKGVNVGGMVGHCAVRHYAMGERSLDEAPASDDDIAVDVRPRRRGDGRRARSASRRRARCCTAFPTAGPCPARGPTSASCSRSPTCSAGTARACTRSRRVFERPGDDYEGTRAEVHWMAEINRRTGRPVTFGLAQSNAGPELFRKILELVDEEAADGGELRPQTTARGIGLLFGMQHRTFFDRAPAWQALQPLSLAAAPRRARRRHRAAAELLRDAEANTPPLDWRRRVRADRRTPWTTRPTPRPRSRPTPTRTARRSPRRSSASRARRRAGRCSTSRSSTSAWTRSRSCSTIPAWRSASATRARTSD